MSEKRIVVIKEARAKIRNILRRKSRRGMLDEITEIVDDSYGKGVWSGFDGGYDTGSKHSDIGHPNAS